MKLAVLWSCALVVAALARLESSQRFDGLESVRVVVERADGYPWLALAVWMSTFLLSLGSKVAVGR